MDEDPSKSLPLDKGISQDKNRSINTTRHSSQVNSLWRGLLVNSPTVWARLIDINILDLAGKYWRDEVLRRTQKSPLHVKGALFPQSLNESESWLLNLLNDNWRRIRKLDLRVDTGLVDANLIPPSTLDCSQTAHCRQVLSFLTKPNSTLEWFRIVFSQFCDLLELGTSLFGNCSPRLRLFQCHSMRFNAAQNSWMSQLQSLHIYDHSGQTFPSVTALCKILSQMPLLKELTIRDCIQSGLSTVAEKNLTPVKLSRLQYLNVSGVGHGASETLAYWNLLETIIPPSGCSVRARLVQPTTTALGARVLHRLAENYFKAHASTHLEISAHRRPGTFRLTDLECPDQPLVIVDPSKTRFFDFTFYHHTVSDLMLYDILEELSSVPFLNVVELCLDVRHMVSRATLPRFSNPRIGELLSSFSLTEKLTTNPETLEILCVSQARIISPLFPRLKVLRMSFRSRSNTSDSHFPENLKTFLMLRKKASVPVWTLELDCISPYTGVEDLRFLENIAGLKVIWNAELIGSGEYICGSGRPEELNFEEKLTKKKKYYRSV